ncbi:MAG: antibiotic biosynthesis monooxygenase [Bryobacteraceae bacterium]
MILLLIELTPIAGKREEIIELLQFSVDRLRTKPGCLSSGVYETCCGGKRTILYLERWRSEEELNRHIQSNLYLAVLNVLDLAAEPPDISFNVIAETKSMELIAALRSPGLPA